MTPDRPRRVRDPGPAPVFHPDRHRLGLLPSRGTSAFPSLTPLLLAPAESVVRSVGWEYLVADFPMFENDRLGCCTIAGVGHLSQVFGVVGGAERLMTGDEVVAGYEAFGYRPTDPTTDRGAVLDDVVRHWLTTGFVVGGAIDRATGAATVDATRPDLVCRALEDFGPLLLGKQLPLAAQSQVLWQVETPARAIDAAGSWGGHCDVLIAAEPPTSLQNLVTYVTWGTLQRSTWEWFLTYVVEARAVLHPSWSAPGGLLHFDAAALRRELDELGPS